MISSIKSSMIARSARAPTFFSFACFAIAISASSSNSSLTSSMASSFWYCFKIAFFGSFKMRTNISSVSASKVNMIGRRPKNSGIMPNLRTSSMVTFCRIFSSWSYLSLSSDLKPIDADLLRRSLMISSNSGNAPPQINRIFLVLTIVMGTMAFLLLAPTGTSTSAPSNSFNIPCCTDSPLTSRWLVLRFFAILSISSIKIIPCSARSTSLSAAASSLLTTLSMSSPIYPASVRDVASVMASGTSKSFASVFTR